MILPHEIFESSADSGPVWVLLHGFLGSRRNLRTLAQDLSALGSALSLDLPNHGEAPVLDPCGYADMAQAVADTVRHAVGNRPWIAVGHSMGGKLAMYMALQGAQNLQALVILDIAPMVYHGDNDPVFDALRQLDLTGVHSRADADRLLQTAIAERAIRLFVLTNLERTPEGSATAFHWRLPLEVLARNRMALRSWPLSSGQCQLPALLVWGTDSPYMPPGALDHARRFFPQLVDHPVAGAAHWLHVSHGPELLYAIRHWATVCGIIQ